jgi:hypothetical protein
MISGRSSEYYLNILKDMYVTCGDNPFSWKDMMSHHPHIDKAVLSRLRSGNYIVKTKAYNVKYNLAWKMHSQVKDILQSNKII